MCLYLDTGTLKGLLRLNEDIRVGSIDKGLYKERK